MSAAASKNQALQPPAKRSLTEENRSKIIDEISAGFVNPGQSNKAIYRMLLEVLLPPGAGFPGPIVDQDQIREFINLRKPNYRDPFRRLRELQGDEGLHSIIQNGARYQWVSPTVGVKRPPRIPIGAQTRDSVVAACGFRCTVCGSPVTVEGSKRASIDHRVPRMRGGMNTPENYQALCSTCNANKQACCSGCELECRTCGWAFPETHLTPVINPEVLAALRTEAMKRGETVGVYLNRRLRELLVVDQSR